MVTHMKTTLEISDNLFRRAKKLAEREGKTFKAVIEEALVTRLEARERAAAPYVLEIPVVSGEIAPEFLNAPWEKIRDELYAYPFLMPPVAAAVSVVSVVSAAKATKKPIHTTVTKPAGKRRAS